MQSLAILHDRSLRNSILGIAIPIALQNLITYMTGMMDTVMLGQLGEVELSGASLANQFGTVYMVLTFGIASGTNVLLSQYWGKGDTRSIRSILSIMYRVTLALSLLFTAAARFFPELILSLFSSDPLVIAAGSRYLALVCFSYTLNGMTNVMLMSLRSVGTVGISILVYSSSFFANTALNWVLIFGKLGFPALGMEGAAIATVISRYVEAAIILVHTHRRREQNPFVEGLYSTLKVPGNLVRKILIKGTPLLLNETLWAAGMAMLSQCYSVRGLNVIAAQNISSTIGNVFNIVFIALGDSVAIIVGQLLGAGKMEEARDHDNKLIAFSVFCCTCVALLMLVLAPLFPMLYNTEADVRELAKYFIMINAVFMPQNAFLHASYFTLRSGGKTIVTFLFDSVFIWCVSVTIAFTLSRFTSLPVTAVFILVQMGDIIKCIIGFVLVKKGVWMQNIVA